MASRRNYKRPRTHPSPAWKVFATPRHVAKATPASFVAIPAQLSYWGNDVDGCCVTSEEFFAKAVWYQYVGGKELFLSYQSATSWARANGFLNGAVITDVMDAMAKVGIVGPDGTTYTDGGYQAVDWTNDATLRSAIYMGPVKLGVAADQLEAVVGASSGWILVGAKTDHAEDHCVSAAGFGTLAQLCSTFNVGVPGRGRSK